MTKNNLQNLSKDELLKLLLQSQSELTETKEELENTRNELKKSNEKNVMLEEQLTGVQKVTAEGLTQLSELTNSLNKRVFILDDVLSKSLKGQLEFAFAEQVEWIQNARSLFNQTSFNKGSDVKGSKKKLDEAEAATKKLNGSINNAGRSIKRVAKTIAEAVTAMAGIDKTTYGKCRCDKFLCRTCKKR